MRTGLLLALILAGPGAAADFAAIPPLGVRLLAITEPEPDRVAAAQALGRIGDWRTVGYLKEGLADPSPEIRAASALALGKVRAPEALPPLVSALSADPEWQVRQAAAAALASRQAPLAVKALGQAAKSDARPEVRREAAQALARIGSREAALALAAPLKDTDPEVRAEAAAGLGRIGGLEALNLLSAALPEETAELPRRVITDALRRHLGTP